MKALARYKFLTYSQMLRLGIDKYKSNLSNQIKGIRDGKRPLIRKIPHQAGIEAKHYLTSKGKDVLLELYPDEFNEDNIHFVKKTLYTDTQDQKHRTGTIDIQITLDAACSRANIPIVLCERYFDRIGNQRKDRNLRSKTAFRLTSGTRVSADLVFKLSTPTQEELYLVELENGSDAGKSYEKCFQHATGILEQGANKKYNHYHAYRTLWIFEKETTMNSTLSKLQANTFFKNLSEYFLFKAFDRIDQDFFSDWLNLDGEERKMYYL
ncbi:MAG: hypothetical protein KDC44_06595 [Phaeodactylibacter sp.]|nr:hypothetical protein [Phaeodactylibacter sp.]